MIFPNFIAFLTLMQEFEKGKMKSMGFVMGLFAGMFVKQIPKLERWKK